MSELEFHDFTQDDYGVFQGMEVDDKPRIAETEGCLDGVKVNFCIIVTANTIYIPVYEPIVNNVDTDIICEFLRTTSVAAEGRRYKGESLALMLNWSNIVSEHLENFGFERIDYKE
jgi:hypothetical protein